MNFKVYRLLIILLVVFSLANCAKRGRPTGGPKDETEPILVSASPKQESTFFNSKKIKISFDEYIKLKDINKTLIISPPFKKSPEITPVGTASKVITIKLFDTLKENTTYTINFGNSVEDNNEGNKLGDFKYVFSTGSYIDSLATSGDVTDAFSRKTDSELLVMLYEMDSTFTDSIIYKEKPMYVTSTLDSTNFNLTNLKGGKYLLLALKQPNNNYIYNPKSDKIAFLKEPLILPNDTVFELSLFKEILPFKFIKAIETSKGHIVFAYQGDPTNFNIQLLDSVPTNFNSEIVFEKDQDTLNYWFKTIEKDSLQFKIANKNYIDTVTVKLKTSKRDSLQLKSNIGSIINFRDTFSIASNIPISKIDASKISVVNVDTIAVPFKAYSDSYKKNIYIHFEKEYNNQYEIKLFPKAVTDAFENVNDTLSYKTKTKEIEDYGILNLSITNVTGPMIIQLITEKDELIATEFIKTDQVISFKNLPPKTYIARAIFDTNDNGKWDTGNFLQKIYPEKVTYYKKSIELRANWDQNEIFKLN